MIEDFMIKCGGRLEWADKWLVSDIDEDDNITWEVYQQSYHQRVKRLLVTFNLEEALKVFYDE